MEGAGIVVWERKWLPVAWLVTWLVAVMSAAVPYWWAVAAVGILFWELTWQMSGTTQASLLSLGRVSASEVIKASGSAIALFGVFLSCVMHWQLPVYGKVSAAKVLWTVLIAPVNEEIFFRGIVYRGLLFLIPRVKARRALEWGVVLIVGFVFAAAHARRGIYFDLTLGAGITYGAWRWRSNSVVPAIVCHAIFNACIMWAFGR